MRDQMQTGYRLVLENGNLLRFHAMGEGEFEAAMTGAYKAAEKDRQNWYASQQFIWQKIRIVAGVR